MCLGWGTGGSGDFEGWQWALEPVTFWAQVQWPLGSLMAGCHCWSAVVWGAARLEEKQIGKSCNLHLCLSRTVPHGVIFFLMFPAGFSCPSSSDLSTNLSQICWKQTFWGVHLCFLIYYFFTFTTPSTTFPSTCLLPFPSLWVVLSSSLQPSKMELAFLTSPCKSDFWLLLLPSELPPICHSIPGTELHRPWRDNVWKHPQPGWRSNETAYKNIVTWWAEGIV